VAKAAMDSGVARKQVDIARYTEQIERILGPTHALVQSIRRDIGAVRRAKKKSPLLVLPHAYDRRILRAAAQIATDGDVRFCLLGSETRILDQAKIYGIPNLEKLVTMVNPFSSEHRKEYADQLYEMRHRKGVSRTTAQQLMLNHNYYAAMMLKAGHADGLVSGVIESYGSSAKPLLEIIGVEDGRTLAGVYMVIVGQKQYFFADCTINVSPDATQLADIAIQTAAIAARYSRDPVRVAMLSFASFGATRHPQCAKVQEAVSMVRERAPELEIDGEMQADVALSAELRDREFPFNRLTGNANVLVFPDLSSANTSYKLLANMTGASLIGPILDGMRLPANILQISANTDEVINMIYVTAQAALARV
jgi:malate dehydrogenase (oxaloacetate-decarboxylating)(NADP+)